MKNKLFIVQKTKSYPTLESVKELPMFVISKLADFEMSLEEFAEHFNIANNLKDVPQEVRELSESIVDKVVTGDYFVITCDNATYPIELGKDDQITLEVNGELDVYVNKRDDGYNVDLYNHHQLDDDGYISSTYASFEDLKDIDTFKDDIQKMISLFELVNKDSETAYDEMMSLYPDVTQNQIDDTVENLEIKDVIDLYERACSKQARQIISDYVFHSGSFMPCEQLDFTEYLNNNVGEG